MRKFFLSIAVCLAAVNANAQLNLQQHYDFGHLNSNLSNRPSMTTTIEYFGTDKWGSTYFFSDIDYYKDGVAGVYWEVSRELSLYNHNTLGFHVEYDGGAQCNQLYETGNRFQHAFLGGLAWNTHNKDFTRTFSAQLMYKYYFKGKYGGAFNSFQATAVWGLHFFDRKLSFTGFADLWYDHNIDNLIFLSEPQLWLNISAFKGCEDIHLSLGGEVELSNNFVYPIDGTNNRFYAIPTLAAKWTF